MEQETIYKIFLITGISLLLQSLACIEEYAMTVDFKYINATDSTIKYYIDSYSIGRDSVILLPNSTSKIHTFNVGGVVKNPDPQNCCQDILVDIYGVRRLEGISSNYIIVNDTLCMVHFEDKSIIISNYKYDIISDRHFRYVYTFTEDDFINVIQCY